MKFQEKISHTKNFKCNQIQKEIKFKLPEILNPRIELHIVLITTYQSARV